MSRKSQVLQFKKHGSFRNCTSDKYEMTHDFLLRNWNEILKIYRDSQKNKKIFVKIPSLTVDEEMFLDILIDLNIECESEYMFLKNKKPRNFITFYFKGTTYFKLFPRKKEEKEDD